MARSLSSALSTHLSGRAFIPVDLYEITIGGTTYRYTSHISDVVADRVQTNLCNRSEPLESQISSELGTAYISDSTLTGFSTALAFTDTADGCWFYVPFTGTLAVNDIITYSFYIRMNDGGVPVPSGASGSAYDFFVTLNGNAGGGGWGTLGSGLLAKGMIDCGGGLYRMWMNYQQPTTAGRFEIGRAGQSSARGFKVSGFQMERSAAGATPGPYTVTTGTAITSGSAGTTYTAGMMLTGAQRQAAGLIVDDLEVTVMHGGTVSIGGKTWVARANSYDLDGAAFRRLEGFLDASTGELVGYVESFVGEVTGVEPSSTQLRLVVSVPTKRFDSGFPSLLCEPGCVWSFGSTGCGYTGTKAFTGTLAANTTASKIRVTALPSGLPGAYPAMNYFNAGTVVLSGYTRTVVDVLDDGYALPCLVVSPPFPAGVAEAAIGGSVTLNGGCTKTAYVCDSHWGRLASFLGAPMAPSSRDAT